MDIFWQDILIPGSTTFFPLLQTLSLTLVCTLCLQASAVISDERYVVENGLTDGHSEPHVKDKVKAKDELVSSTDFVSRGNVVKSSGHSDTIVKDGWKPTGGYQIYRVG